jgi:hypothetical protein
MNTPERNIGGPPEPQPTESEQVLHSLFTMVQNIETNLSALEDQMRLFCRNEPPRQTQVEAKETPVTVFTQRVNTEALEPLTEINRRIADLGYRFDFNPSS